MTQKEKDLLLKDLCARLPYGVKIKTSYNKIDEPIELIFINPRNESFAIGSNFTITSGLSFDIYECKPYLFPLESMTEEQEKEYNDLNCYELGWFPHMEAALDYLIENHFDYRGLIDEGLAIDATGLNIY